MRSFVLATALIALPAAAVTLVPLSDAQLAAHASTIVLVTVTQTVQSTLDPDGDGVAQPWTTVTARIDEVLKGQFQPGDTLTFVQMGGTANGRTLRLAGMPAFAAGDRALLFLNDRLDNPAYTPLVGWSQGVFRVKQAADGGLSAKRDFGDSCWMDPTGQATRAPATPEEDLQAVLDRFEQEVQR